MSAQRTTSSDVAKPEPGRRQTPRMRPVLTACVVVLLTSAGVVGAQAPQAEGGLVVPAGNEAAVLRAARALEQGGAAGCALRGISIEGGEIASSLVCDAETLTVVVTSAPPSEEQLGESLVRNTAGLWLRITPGTLPASPGVATAAEAFARALSDGIFVDSRVTPLPPPTGHEASGAQRQSVARSALAVVAATLLLLLAAWSRRRRHVSATACLFAALYLLGSAGFEGVFPFSSFEIPLRDDAQPAPP